MIKKGDIGSNTDQDEALINSRSNQLYQTPFLKTDELEANPTVVAKPIKIQQMLLKEKNDPKKFCIHLCRLNQNLFTKLFCTGIWIV